MKKYICIHGHFYQPPRENPWLEAITPQESAFPYHDWNERITAECYAPNTLARILDEEGLITEMVNNYSKISFDFGPTLLGWMELNAPKTYQAILAADRESQKRFSGHGSGLAQCYSHMIMPLANHRDKYTQVYWGIRDFEYRFKRFPEGMWLPETAVDIETLEIMVEFGIRFTILAPHQAARFRFLEGGRWREPGEGGIDTTQPYVLGLPSGGDIHIFFYQGPLSRAVAFENLLHKGEAFAHRLLKAFPGKKDHSQLVHIATDGETYGHHHKFGDMALASALKYIDDQSEAKLTNYGEFLEKYPSTHEVEIIENTSWSCEHGVERWKSNCGCHIGGDPSWNQKWRKPLREALDDLRYTLISPFKEKAQPFFKDPWEARDSYIQVILDRSQESIDQFFAQHALRELNGPERILALKLLELQRNAMLMYTSCGWFSCDLSGIETEQILQFAGRVVQLADELFERNVEPQFLKFLEKAESNLVKKGNGRAVYENTVDKSTVVLSKLCAHFALGSLFEEFNHLTRIYSYTVELEDYQNLKYEKARLALGWGRVTSIVTLEPFAFHFSVMHQGDYHLKNFIHQFEDVGAYSCSMEEAKEGFLRGDFEGTLSHLENHFGGISYPLKSLSKNEQKKIFDEILWSTLDENEKLYQKLYESYAPLNRYLKDQDIVPSKIFSTFMEAVLNAKLRKAFADPDFKLIHNLMEEVRIHGPSMDLETFKHIFKDGVERMAREFYDSPANLTVLENFGDAVNLLSSMSLQVDLWKSQNICYEIKKNLYDDYEEKRKLGDPVAEEWIKRFKPLAEALSIQIA